VNTSIYFIIIIDVSIERREVIADKILCAFLQAIIKLVEKLDLGTKEKRCLAGVIEVIV
jgi:hypothetical protein